MASHGFARPNLLGRMYLRLDAAGGEAQMFCLLDLAERIEPAALRRAVAGVLDDLPQLRTRVVRHWYAFRRVLVPSPAVDLATVLTATTDDGAAEAFLDRKPDLARELPVRVLLHQTPSHDRLVLAMHHSVGDGHSLLFVLARLGARYEEMVSSVPASRVTVSRRETRYRDLLQLLSWWDRWRALQTAVRYVWDASRLPGSAAAVPLATFTDQPLPARGRLRYARIGLSANDAARVKRWADEHHGSAPDVLLTASLRAAMHVWPDEAARPVMVSLPVSIRAKGNDDVANQVGVMDFPVYAGDFDHVFTQVSAATVQARKRLPAIVNVFAFAVVSCLPPAVFERLARGYFSQAVNVRESLPFTALRGPDAAMRRFGPVAVTDSMLGGSVIAPPGLKVLVSPHDGRVNVGVFYLDPVTTPRSIAAFTDALRAELDSLA